ncbi:MAG: futalosine hydrolase [Acidobacteria bacterium]|nr:futalosine hydrolase [Acidobacteriota bacterium]
MSSSSPSAPDGDENAARGTRMARREGRARREYWSVEQRRQPGRPARQVAFEPRGRAAGGRPTRLLVVAATPGEIAPVVERLGDGIDNGLLRSYCRHTTQIDVLITGVGMVPTAVWCTRALAKTRYDLCINCGVCGSFDPALAPGTVVRVASDRIAGLGAESGDELLSLAELGLAEAGPHKLSGGGELRAACPANAAIRTLPAVRGITVNAVHGSERSIRLAVERFQPQVESMEGAAFMYACMAHGVELAQIRAVSNVVEPRNRQAWKLPEAIASLGEAALRILDQT